MLGENDGILRPNCNAKKKGVKMQEETSRIRMNRIRFAEEISRQVLAVLGEGYETELSRVRKNNGVLKDVLHIRKAESECIPCFYMDELYRSYCSGESELLLAEQLADIVWNECERVREQVPDFLERDWIVSHLFIRMIQAESNEEWLQDAVYVEYLDLLAVFYVLTEDAEEGIKSYQLPKNVWEALELGDAQAYFPTVVANTRHLFPEKMWCVEHTVRECNISGTEQVSTVLVPAKEYISQQLYVLSNYRRINGAAVVLYPDLLRQLGEKFGGDFYVIPSSVHEVLLLKKTEEEEPERLNRTIQTVNEQQVQPEEVLSNHVYLYSAEDAILRSLTEV